MAWAAQCRVWRFDFETSGFRNFLIFLDGCRICFGKFWYRKKYWYQFGKKIGIKKVLVSVSKTSNIEKKELVLKSNWISFKKYFASKVFLAINWVCKFKLNWLRGVCQKKSGKSLARWVGWVGLVMEWKSLCGWFYEHRFAVLRRLKSIGQNEILKCSPVKNLRVRNGQSLLNTGSRWHC